MEVKKIVEGMTASEVAQVIDDNFKAQKKILEDDIKKQNDAIGVSEYKAFSESESVAVGDVRLKDGVLYECVEATTGEWNKNKWKVTSFKKETESKLAELASGIVPVKVGKNLLDLESENIVPDKMLYSGKENKSDKYDISDYIRVDENTEYCYSISGANNYVITGGAGVAFYDRNKNILGYTQDITDAKAVYTTPEGCYYMRLSIYKSTAKYDVQFEKGNERSEYERYSIVGGYIEGNKGIERVKEDIKSLREDVYTENPVSELQVRHGKEFTELYYLKESELSDIYDYGKIDSGTALKVYVENDNTSKIVRFYDSYAFASTAKFVDVSVNSGSINDLIVPEGYNYLKLCVNKDTKPSVNIITSTKEVLAEIEKNTMSANQSGSMLGSNASRGYVAKLNSGKSLVLDNFPLHCKKGLAMSMAADIVSFNKIIFGKGYGKYRGRWLEIDNQNVVLKGYENNAYIIGSVAHGIEINSVIKVSLACDYSGKCKVVVMSKTGLFTHVFNWGYDGNYEAMVLSSGSELNNVFLNATTTDFRQPVWFFGASYLGISKNRLLGQLKNLGYFNYLIDNLAGMGSNDAYNDLTKCLDFGTPKFLVWCLGFNDFKNLENAISVAKKVEKICEDKNIVLLFGIYPSTPERDMTVYQEWLRDSGNRLIDIDKAVGSPMYASGVNNWYPEYLSTDNVHPTELGAKAMAMQVLTDFPEIMQYGLYKDDVTLEETE